MNFWLLMIFELMLTTSLMYQFPELRGGTGASDTLVSRLWLHTCILMAASFALSTSSNVTTRARSTSLYIAQTGRFLMGWVIGLIYFYLAVVIFGASVSEQYAQTCLWAGSMAALCAAPLAALQMTSISALTRQNAIVWLPILGALVGSWFGATFVPLDWDRPWQVWPLPVTAGAAYGHNLGAVLSLGLWVIYGSRKGSVHDPKSSTVPP